MSKVGRLSRAEWRQKKQAQVMDRAREVSALLEGMQEDLPVARATREVRAAIALQEAQEWLQRACAELEAAGAEGGER